MATTSARPAAGLPPLRSAALAGKAGARPPQLLGAALGIAAVYAAFADGATSIPEESRLQVFIAAVAIVTVAALFFGRSLRAAASSPAWVGALFLFGFAVWSSISIAWSIVPDGAWVEANRALAYSLVLGLGIVLGASLPRAAERIAMGWLAVATLVSLYALGGKLAPWLEIPGVFDLNPSGGISRLREPIGYWNGLALLMVMALPVALRAAVDAARSEQARLLARLAAVPLLIAAVLALSRGALLVLAAAFMVQLALSDDRQRLLATAGVVVLASLPALLLGLTLNDLTGDNVKESARVGEGLLLFVVFVFGLMAVAVLGRRTADRELGATGALLRPPVLVTGAALIAIGLVLAGLNEGGSSGGGTVTPGASSVSAPTRLLQSSSSHRSDWWSEAAGAWSDRPLIGHGAGSFPLLHKLYREDPVVDVQQAHSVPLEFLAETGLIGAALALGGLALLFAAAFRSVLARTDERQRGYAVALLVAAGAWSLHSLIDWHWDIPAVTLPALVFLGALAARPRDDSAPPSAWRARPSQSVGGGAYGLGLAAFTALMAAFAFSAVLPALAEDRSDEAFLVGQSRKGDLREAAEKAESAARLNPFSVDGLLAGSVIAQERGDAKRAGRLLLEAVDRQPENPNVWYELARLQALYDNYPAAYASIRTAIALDRGDDLALAAVNVIRVDERRSASATGTPLPKKLPKAPEAPAAPAPTAPSAPQTGTPPPTTPQAPAAPAPAPAPTPAPPAPTPAPDQGFRLEG